VIRVLASTISVQLQQKLLHREFWTEILIGRILPILIPLLAWQAIFDFSGTSEFGGWQKNQMEAYYLLVFIISLFADIQFHYEMSSMVQLGTLNQWLIRPLSFCVTIASFIIARILMLIIPGLIGLALGAYFMQGFVGSFSITNLATAIVVLPCSLIIFACLSAAIGMLSFWIIRTESVFALIMLILEFFGGRLIPLSLFPAWLEKISIFLPLRYAIFLPVEAILQPSRQVIFSVIVGQLAWSVVLLAIAMLLWKTGIRRYDAVGG